MTETQKVVLTHTIEAAPVAEDFELVSMAMPELGDGEILVRTIYISQDPYVGSVLRGRHMATYIPGRGDTVPGNGIAQVIASSVDNFTVGDYVVGEIGWRSHAAVKAETMRKVDPTIAPLSTHLGVAGMPGLTAYASVHHLAKVKKGDHVLISSAAGPVGGTVGQLARIYGAERVIGVAGSDEKRALVKGQYGFDDCINYKNDGWKDDLAAAFPKGINVYHDNVGGDMLMTALLNLADYGRIVLCGLASQYHADERPGGPNPGTYIVKRAQLFGLVVYDFLKEQDAFAKKAGDWIKEGKLTYIEDRAEGLDQAPSLFAKMIRGENVGKCIVAVGPESI